MRKGTAGIMLTEVLIVAGILAVLVALLVPSMGRLMQSSQNTACTAKLRQIGTAIQSYAADNNGLILPNRTKPGSARDYWVGLLAPYLGAKSADDGFLGSQDRSPYMCPTAKTNTSGLSYYALPVSGNVSYRTRYDINSHITTAYEPELTNPSTFRSGRMNQMKASKTYILMDGFGSGGGGFWIVGSGRLTYPHDKHLNVLYLDNHVESKTRAEMERYASSPYHIFWRGYDWGFPGYRED